MGEALWPDAVAARARRSPEAIAVHGAGPTLTYAQLDASSTRLARRLIARGVGPESVAALLLDRTSALIVAMLAVAKAGGAYLPMDPAHPSERLAFMLDDAAPALVITDTEVGVALAGGRTVLGLDSPDLSADGRHSLVETITDVGRIRPLSAGHAAYVIYTSGSTGRPKSVLVTHRGVMNMVDQQVDHFAVRPGSRVLQCASIGFDAAFSEIAMALCAGARLELASAAELVPGPALVATVARRGVTHLTITPSALAVLDPGDLPSVSTLVVAGEACPSRLVDRWATGRRMINAYGPTEATVCATMSDPLGGAPPIGRPLAGTRAEVLDERLRPMPVGAVGELWVSGLGVARGYLGRPGLTAERFVADPRGEPGARMYRTGDLCYLDEDGRLWFVGRDDDQVQIRGHRVDTGEVAAVLGEHAAVRDARVVARPDGRGANRLVAYVVPTEPGSPAGALTGPLRDWARKRLPEAMVPATVTTLDRLPLNAHGKLDLDALRAAPRPTAPGSKTPGSNAPESKAPGSEAPRSKAPGSEAADGGATRLLCDLFTDTLDLGAHVCGPDDDFFDLGGHSLTGVLLLGRIRTVFGVRLALPELALAPTPRALTARLGRSGPGRTLGTGHLLPLRPRGDESPVFCLPPAAGLGWPYGRLLGGIAPGHPVYAVQTPGLKDGESPIDTMTGLVEHCVRLIRGTRPEGPYHLLGWSFGGVLAHAVAVRLRRAGDRVGLLGVLDGYPGHGGTLAATGSAADIELDEPTARRLLFDSLGGGDLPWPRGMLDVLRTNVRLQRRHVPGVFDGRLTLFAAARPGPGERPDPAMWEPYLTGEPRVVRVPTDHHGMLGPTSLAVLAPVLAGLLGDPRGDPTDDPTAGRDPARRPDPFDGPCHVLRNHAGQYSLWPATEPVPPGWRAVLTGQDHERCLAYVEHAWTDPLLLGGPDGRIDV